MSGRSSLVGNDSPHPSRDEEEGLSDSSSETDDDDDDQHRNNLEEAWLDEETSTVTWVMAELKRAARDLRELSSFPEVQVGGGGGVRLIQLGDRCLEISQLLRGTAMGTLMELEHVKLLLKTARIRVSTMEKTNRDLQNQVEFLIAKLDKARVNVKELEGQLEAMKDSTVGEESEQVITAQSHQEQSNNGSADAGEESEEEPEDELAPPPSRSALAKRRSTRPDAHLNVKKCITWDASVKNPALGGTRGRDSPVPSEMSREPETLQEQELVLGNGDVGTGDSLAASVQPLRAQSPQECGPGREGSDDDDADNGVISLGIFGNDAATTSSDNGDNHEVPGSSMDIRDGNRNQEAAPAAEGINNCQDGNVHGNGPVEQGSNSRAKCTYQLRRRKTIPCNLLNHGALAVRSPPSASKLKMKTSTVQEGKTRPAKPPKKFQCNKCDARFGKGSNLRRHMTTIHNPQPLEERSRYKCKKCTKCFNFQHALARHMLAHSNVRRFQCTLCSKRFKVQDHLKVHLQRHGDETPYQCKECGKGFKTASTLWTHVLLHAGKPHKCQRCDMAFSLKGNLKRHERRRHPCT